MKHTYSLVRMFLVNVCDTPYDYEYQVRVRPGVSMSDARSSRQSQQEWAVTSTAAAAPSRNTLPGNQEPIPCKYISAAQRRHLLQPTPSLSHLAGRSGGRGGFNECVSPSLRLVRCCSRPSTAFGERPPTLSSEAEPQPDMAVAHVPPSPLPPPIPLLPLSQVTLLSLSRCAQELREYV